MLRTLVESKGRSPRQRVAMTASVSAHAMLLFALVWTRAVGTAVETELPLSPIVYFPPKQPEPTLERPDHTHPATADRDRLLQPPIVPLPERVVGDIPDLIGPIVPAHFTPGRISVRDSVSDVDRGRTRVLTERTVDQPVELLPNQRAPRYPLALERAGVNGDVIVQFVVDTTGHVERASIVIQHTSHAEFARTVQERLLALRFVPARARARVVRQLVEQRFTFEVVRR
ncbi:MAG: TonB family protein [Gemmatimonadaceae bacterium]